MGKYVFGQNESTELNESLDVNLSELSNSNKVGWALSKKKSIKKKSTIKEATKKPVVKKKIVESKKKVSFKEADGDMEGQEESGELSYVRKFLIRDMKKNYGISNLAAIKIAVESVMEFYETIADRVVSNPSSAKMLVTTGLFRKAIDRAKATNDKIKK